MPISDMFNPLMFLRQQNILQPQPQPVDETIETGPELSPEMLRMRELYQPDTTAQDKYNEIAARMPQRNKPGALRRIGA
jgi:hypothetical protein